MTEFPEQLQHLYILVYITVFCILLATLGLYYSERNEKTCSLLQYHIYGRVCFLERVCVFSDLPQALEINWTSWKEYASYWIFKSQLYLWSKERKQWMIQESRQDKVVLFYHMFFLPGNFSLLMHSKSTIGGVHIMFILHGRELFVESTEIRNVKQLRSK